MSSFHPLAPGAVHLWSVPEQSPKTRSKGQDHTATKIDIPPRFNFLVTKQAVLYSGESPPPVQISRVFFMSDGKPAPQNIQDAFLNTVRREKTTVTIHLVNGAKLTGRIRSFDKFSILLEAGQHEQLVFKHAISTISQSRRPSGDLRVQMAPEVAVEPSQSLNQLGNRPVDSATDQASDSPES